MARRVLIVGGGIAGLSTGCYGRMNGYETEIFEMHTVPGGVCTGWQRKGYTFDGCLHFLVGSAPSHSFHQVWRELGALAGKRVIDHEVSGAMVLPSGRKLLQYADIDRLVRALRQELAGLGRHDLEALDRLAADVKHWATLKMPLGAGSPAPKPSGTSRCMAMIASAPGMARRARGMWRFRTFMPVMKRFRGSVDQYVSRFESPELQSFFRLINPIPEMPATSLLMMLSSFHSREAGWPEGGSLALASSIARRYEELGGVVHYGAKVEEILVRDGRATGVRLSDGSEHFGDEVISAADGHTTLFQMLKGQHMSPQLETAYERLRLYTPIVQVSFGVKRCLSLSEFPRLTTYQFDNPLRIGGTSASFLMLNNYAFDPLLAPAGKSSLTLLFLSPWEHWEKLSGNRTEYLAEKGRILEDATRWLESQIPDIGGDIETSDVATPLTTVRYTGNYHASYEGWRPSVETMRVKIDKRLPGLSGFSMVGQWTAPFAGLPSVAKDGRVAIQELCAQDGKEFKTTIPDDDRDSGASSGVGASPSKGASPNHEAIRKKGAA